MTKKRSLELLAPAGDFEKMKYALAYGADAIYMGIPDFSLRVRVNHITLDQIQEAIRYVHALHKKIYITINIFAHNEHLKKLPLYLKKLNQWGPDALIVSDPGIIQMVKTYAPDLSIHLSTQANTTNWQAVKFWYDQGIERVVLGREVSLLDIREIHRRVPKCELEYFVHGAMCMSYSGRCMLSAWLTGRSANLGDCAQPCRWKYDMIAPSSSTETNASTRGNKQTNFGGILTTEVEEPLRPGMKIPVEEDVHGTYIFNSKDLCLIEYLPELVEAGVVSFKIEGRAKSVAYLSSVVKAYDQGFETLGHVKDIRTQKRTLRAIKKKTLYTLTNRGYTTGFLFGRETVEQNCDNSHTKGEEEFVGEVIDCQKDGKRWKTIIRPHNALRTGDVTRIMQPTAPDLRLSLKELYTENAEKIDSLHGGTGKLAHVYTSKPVQKFGILFKQIGI